MATSGKKGKKNKGKVISLQSFLDNGETTPGVTQVAKKVRPRGGTEESDEDDTLPQVYQLPTAPRASRNFDDDSVPHKPPYLAYISNLPFDIKEEDIHDFFEIPIINLRLPREDGESGRLRGFGYIEFDTREDLILAISLSDPHIKNRRVRIDVSNENEQNQNNRRGRDGGMNNRSRYDGFGGSSENQNRDSTDWRRDNPRPQGNDDSNRNDNRRGGGYGYRDRQPREPRDGSQEGGSWRTGDRPAFDTSPRRDGGDRYGRERDGGGGGRRNDRDGEFRSRKPASVGGGGSGGGEEETAPQERPKLNLKPRTLPLPEIVTKCDDEIDSDTERQSTPEPPKSKGVSAASVFGSAKPVDTATREKEIEERIEKERVEKIEKIKLEKEIKEKEKQMEKEKDQENNENIDEKETESEKDDKENKNTTISWRIREENNKVDGEQRKYSPDRRGPQRRNDERRVGRDNRDNRDGRDQRRGDYNRSGYDRDNRNRDTRTDRSDRDFNRDRPYNNKDGKIPPRENKQRDEKPAKKEPTKIERPMPKYTPPVAAPVLQSANKYSGLLDEEDGSE